MRYALTCTDRLETLHREAAERLYRAHAEWQEAMGEYVEVGAVLVRRKRVDGIVARREGGAGFGTAQSVGCVSGGGDGGVTSTVEG